MAIKGYDRALMLERAIDHHFPGSIPLNTRIRLRLDRAAITGRRQIFDETMADFTQVEQLLAADSPHAAGMDPVERDLALRVLHRERGLFLLRTAHYAEGAEEIRRSGFDIDISAFPDPLRSSAQLQIP